MINIIAEESETLFFSSSLFFLPDYYEASTSEYSVIQKNEQTLTCISELFTFFHLGMRWKES